MARSQALGHCVCDLKLPCPCPELVEHDVCHCAGERRSTAMHSARLTQLVRKAGCASKIGQAELSKLLQDLPPIVNPNIIVGTTAGDDAGIYRLDDRTALVQTVDVFTPCVDDPYLFGQIAAANSVSDVYAMGGRPITALSIVGFPIDDLDGAILTEILRGGIEKLEEAGCSLIGGHSINDPEIKCGFAVTGLIATNQAMLRDTPRVGDVLVLTKPLGTGIVVFAAQTGRVGSDELAEAGRVMATLNRDAAELMVEYDASACTDITGFGLAGHLASMVRGSGVTIEIDVARLPMFAAAAECLRQGVYSGAVEKNRAYAGEWMCVVNGTSAALPILFDPQTSGGLLIALPEHRAGAFIERLHAKGHLAASIIGRVLPPQNGQRGMVRVIDSGPENVFGEQETHRMADPAHAEGCCDHAGAPHTGPSTDALPLFSAFMTEANKPGLIDARAKKLLVVALSVVQRCKPCLKIHLRAAVEMGIPRAEIEEAVSLAVAFGGCSALMFYKEVCAELRL